jgi:hypothetical protein
VVDLAGVDLGQGFFVGTLHCLVHRDSSTTIGGIEGEVSRL